MDFSFLDEWTEEEKGAVVEEVGEGYRHIWVVAEVADGGLLPASLEAMGQARELADRIGVYAYGVVLGDDVTAPGESLFGYGADRVLVADDPALAGYLPGLYAKILADLVNEYHPEVLLLPATLLGDDLAPRLAQRLGTGLISHCVKLDIDMSERLLLGTCPAMGGEVFHTFACPQARPQMATLQPGAFRLPYQDSHRSGSVQQVDLDLAEVSGRLAADDARGLAWTDLDASVELPAVPLSKARIVVSAGRGMGSADGFARVEELAAALGGVVAGSRGALDECWIGEERVVGVGGEMIAPDLYIACGISGDIYHYFGLQNARFVVAINADENAPIMKVANMAIVGDARQIIPAMLEALAA
jgi:electron transfer flavoprotein alpha subunit